MFSRSEPEKKEEPKPKPEAANDNFAAFATAIGDQMATQLAAAVQPIAEAQAKFRTDMDALVARLEKTPSGDISRTPATGGTGEILTDF